MAKIVDREGTLEDCKAQYLISHNLQIHVHRLQGLLGSFNQAYNPKHTQTQSNENTQTHTHIKRQTHPRTPGFPQTQTTHLYKTFHQLIPTSRGCKGILAGSPMRLRCPCRIIEGTLDKPQKTYWSNPILY